MRLLRSPQFDNNVVIKVWLRIKGIEFLYRGDHSRVAKFFIFIIPLSSICIKIVTYTACA